MSKVGDWHEKKIHQTLKKVYGIDSLRYSARNELFLRLKSLPSYSHAFLMKLDFTEPFNLTRWFAPSCLTRTEIHQQEGYDGGRGHVSLKNN